MECRIGDISIHYEAMGEGRPVVLLHGFSPDYRLMAGCMEPVFRERENYRRIYIDLPGMGRSGSSDRIANSDHMLDVVLEAIDSILPRENYLLAGESYGGYLSRGILHRSASRVDGLMLICPVIGPRQEGEDPKEPVAVVRDEALLGRLTEDEAKWFADYSAVLTEDVYSRYREEIVPGVQLADSAFLEKIRRNGYYFTFDPAGEDFRFEKPALFLMGRQDAVVGYQNAWGIYRNFPRATLAVLDRAAHNLQIEQPGLFRTLVSEWLDRVEEFSAESPKKRRV